MLSLSKENLNITLITDNKSKDKIRNFMVNDFNIQCPSNKLTVIKNDGMCHDRFIIVDFNTNNEKIYHCGASLKDAGSKITSINEIVSVKGYKQAIKKLLRSPILKLK